MAADDLSDGTEKTCSTLLPGLSQEERNYTMKQFNEKRRLTFKFFRNALALFAISAIGILPLGNRANAQLDFGADVVSRYVWRGTDFGDAVSAQPWISYSASGFEIGAWSSWAWTDPGANENDLYVSYSTDMFGVAVTDYYFPAAPTFEDGTFGFFTFEDDGAGAHWLEGSVSASTGPFSALVGMFFFNDPDNSIYVEGSYEFLSNDDISASVVAGAGNGMYTMEPDGEDDSFNVVQIGLSASKDRYFASYIINPDTEAAWLYFGVSF